jgi:hypothetical protein
MIDPSLFITYLYRARVTLSHAAFFFVECFIELHLHRKKNLLKDNTKMNNSYADLVDQTFNFPQEDFKVEAEYLQYNGQDLKALIDKYGTPLKLTYLPKIGMQINKAKICSAKRSRNTGTRENITIVIVQKAPIFLSL